MERVFQIGSEHLLRKDFTVPEEMLIIDQGLCVSPIGKNYKVSTVCSLNNGTVLLATFWESDLLTHNTLEFAF